MSRHGYYKQIGSSFYWEPDNPYCFYGEDCDVCNPDGIYSGDDDRKPPREYRDEE